MRAWFPTLVAVLSSGLLAQTDAPDSSIGIPPTDADPRQPAQPFGKPFTVHFPIRAALANSQQLFDRGVALLHAGADFEAERCFRQVAVREPDQLLAYWGMAMANFDAPSRAARFLE